MGLISSRSPGRPRPAHQRGQSRLHARSGQLQKRSSRCRRTARGEGGRRGGRNGCDFVGCVPRPGYACDRPFLERRQHEPRAPNPQTVCALSAGQPDSVLRGDWRLGRGGRVVRTPCSTSSVYGSGYSKTPQSWFTQRMLLSARSTTSCCERSWSASRAACRRVARISVDRRSNCGLVTR